MIQDVHVIIIPVVVGAFEVFAIVFRTALPAAFVGPAFQDLAVSSAPLLQPLGLVAPGVSSV